MASSKWQEGYDYGLGGGSLDYSSSGWKEWSRDANWRNGWGAGNEERRRREREQEESEKNEERRHRELLDAVESRDDGEDYEEESRSPIEPLIYSEKTRRASGMNWLKNIITRIENEDFFWSSYENSDSDCGYDGSAPDGRYRIRICVESPYLDFATRVSKILELEDFNVYSSYHPLSDEEKALANKLASKINVLIETRLDNERPEHMRKAKESLVQAGRETNVDRREEILAKKTLIAKLDEKYMSYLLSGRYGLADEYKKKVENLRREIAGAKTTPVGTKKY